MVFNERNLNQYLRKIEINKQELVIGQYLEFICIQHYSIIIF